MCSSSERFHNRVKTWTRHVDLFSKEYIVIPVCDRWVSSPHLRCVIETHPLSPFRAHWYVMLICHPGKFDADKAAPLKPAGKRRKKKKLLTLRKRKKGRFLDSSESQETDEKDSDDNMETETVKSDPLYMGAYNSDEDGEGEGEREREREGEEGEKKEPLVEGSGCPGSSLITALLNTEQFQESQVMLTLPCPNVPF